MTPEDEWPVGQPVPRDDSFEVIEGGAVELTDEEKAWPVGRPIPREASFEVVAAVPVGELVVRVTADTATATAYAHPLIDRLRAAIDEFRAASGGHPAVRLELPAPPA